MTNDDAFMALAGVRYCLGRHTYAPSLCYGWLRRKWSEFDERDQRQILKEFQDHISYVEGRDDWIARGWEDDLKTWRDFSDWAAARADARSRAGGGDA